MVEAMAGFGIQQSEMVKLLINPYSGKPISEVTLIKHFREELDRGMTHANVRVMQGMFKNCTTPTGTYPGGNPLLQIFWAKTRLRWQAGVGGHGAPGDHRPPEEADERTHLEIARRVAFVLVSGARAAPAIEASKPAAPKKAATTPA